MLRTASGGVSDGVGLWHVALCLAFEGCIEEWYREPDVVEPASVRSSRKLLGAHPQRADRDVEDGVLPLAVAVLAGEGWNGGFLDNHSLHLSVFFFSLSRSLTASVSQSLQKNPCNVQMDTLE